MNRIQFILSLDLLLQLLSCKPLLSSDCLHCQKTSINLFDSIILSNIFVESTSVTVNISQKKFLLLILYLFYNANLLKICNNIKLQISITNFVNNVNILIKEIN